MEATPDFYIRKQEPLTYLAIGEVESTSSRDPEMQLVIGTLGILVKKTTKIGAVLMRRSLDCSIFLGTCSWGAHGYGSVTFKRVNRASGYHIEDPEELKLLAELLLPLYKIDSRQQTFLTTYGIMTCKLLS